MSGVFTPRNAVLGVVALGVLESVAGLVVARDPPKAPWSELSAELAQRGDGDPVIVAQSWLSPLARQHLVDAADLTALTLPDLYGVGRFHTIGWDDDGADAVAAQLEGLPMPIVEAERSFGALSWTTWRAEHAGTTRSDLTATMGRATVRTGGGTCRGRGTYRCAEGEVGPALVEVDYLPRQCLGLTVGDGTTVQLSWPSVELGDALRGHLGFGNYNARLRNDAPARVVVRVDGEEKLRLTVTDAEGWRPFVVPTSPGNAAVDVEITVGLGGTFATAGYDASSPRTTCLELRAIAGAG